MMSYGFIGYVPMQILLNWFVATGYEQLQMAQTALVFTNSIYKTSPLTEGKQGWVMSDIKPK